MFLYKNKIVITGGSGRFGSELKKIKNKEDKMSTFVFIYLISFLIAFFLSTKIIQKRITLMEIWLCLIN